MHKIPSKYENPIDRIFLRITEKMVPPLRETLGLTPNMVTVLSGILGLVSLYFLYRQELIPFLILFIISNLLDACDGYMARRYRMESDLGDYLDHLFDNIRFISYILILYFVAPWNKISAAAKAILVTIFVVLSFLSAVHLGCQERLSSYPNHNQVLQKLIGLCPNPREMIQYTRYFGCGTLFLYQCFLPFYLKYKHNS